MGLFGACQGMGVRDHRSCHPHLKRHQCGLDELKISVPVFLDGKHWISERMVELSRTTLDALRPLRLGDRELGEGQDFLAAGCFYPAGFERNGYRANTHVLAGFAYM